MPPIGTGAILTQLELTWYASRSSLPSQGDIQYTLDDHKRAYFSRGSLASAGLKSVYELEREWLGLITGISQTQGQQALWQSAVAQYTPALTPTIITSENKWTFYSFASGIA